LGSLVRLKPDLAKDLQKANFPARVLDRVRENQPSELRGQLVRNRTRLIVRAQSISDLDGCQASESHLEWVFT
jgi:hypothetical protein